MSAERPKSKGKRQRDAGLKSRGSWGLAARRVELTTRGCKEKWMKQLRLVNQSEPEEQLAGGNASRGFVQEYGVLYYCSYGVPLVLYCIKNYCTELRGKLLN